jgi:hypothetical protein
MRIAISEIRVHQTGIVPAYVDRIKSAGTAVFESSVDALEQDFRGSCGTDEVIPAW